MAWAELSISVAAAAGELLDGVHTGMRPPDHLDEVLGPVVVAHPVQMMNDLTRENGFGGMTLVPDLVAALDRPAAAVVPGCGPHSGFAPCKGATDIASSDEPLAAVPSGTSRTRPADIEPVTDQAWVVLHKGLTSPVVPVLESLRRSHDRDRGDHRVTAARARLLRQSRSESCRLRAVPPLPLSSSQNHVEDMVTRLGHVADQSRAERAG